MKRAVPLAIVSGLLMALTLPQAIPWISLRELDPAGYLELIAWVALAPALFALDRARTWRVALALGLLAGLAYFYGAIWWVNHAMTSFGGVPFPIALLGLTFLVLYMAAHWAAAFLASWTIRQRLGWPFWMHLPAVWVASELSRNYLFTGFPWGNLGYVQARHPAVAQLASLTGVYGVAALVVLVNCVVHASLRARADREPLPWRLVAATAGLLALVAGYGEAHLSAVRARIAAAPKLTVALVQGNVNQSVKNQASSYAADILRRYVPLTLEADRRGVDLIAWPEAAYPYLLPPNLASFDDRRIGLPRLTRAHLLLGAGTYSQRIAADGRTEAEGANSVFLLRPDLTVLDRYAKHHLVPFGEYVPLQPFLGHFLRSVVPEMVPQRPGSELKVLEFTPTASEAVAPPVSPGLPRKSPADVPPLPGRPDGGEGISSEPGALTSTATPPISPEGPEGLAFPPATRLAPMICFDAIFPEVNVAYAMQEPEILLNPTNDAWYGYSSGPYQFLAIVRMRAIEAGKAVVRPAYAGVTALIDPTGELQPGALPVGPVDLDLAPDPEEPPRLLVGQVARLRGRTLYTTFGDLFAGVASAYGAIALAFALRGRRVREKE
ncbi:MAG: apolipoprotein N-acyltransferase [Anaeromyxobacter sp. RBG_16_69_14]|nr:MAG: apolipoprotein N-acyltransferase [Anaeromyxobacter sp. RBG_16_69_14]